VLQSEQTIDTILADYHLGDGVDGIELLRRLRDSERPPSTAALISADHDAGLALVARTAGYPLLYKPLAPGGAAGAVECVPQTSEQSDGRLMRQVPHLTHRATRIG
jgi:CheY-like chemotaxis protein